MMLLAHVRRLDVTDTIPQKFTLLMCVSASKRAFSILHGFWDTMAPPFLLGRLHLYQIPFYFDFFDTLPQHCGCFWILPSASLRYRLLSVYGLMF